MPGTAVRFRGPLTLAVIWVFVALVYCSTISETWRSTDVASANVGAWHLATAGNPWMDEVMRDDLVLSVDPNDTAASAPRGLGLFTARNPTNGHVAIARSPGAIAAGVPAYWLADRLGWRTGSGDISPVPGALMAACLGATSVLLLMLSTRGLVSSRLVVGTGLALAFTTPYWSVLGDALWSHGVTVLGIAGMAWATRRERWWLVGVFGGIGLWGRLHVALVVAVLGVGLSLCRRRPMIAAWIAATSIPFLVALFVWGRWTYGEWSLYAASGAYGQASGAGSPEGGVGVAGNLVNLLGYLFSPDAGMFVWTPVLVPLAPAVVRGWRSAPDWTKVLTGAGVTYLMAQCVLNWFAGGTGFWGNRLGLETLTCIFPLVACSIRHGTRPERALGLVLLAYQAGVIALGAVFDLAHRKGLLWREYEPWLAFRDNAPMTSLVILVGMLITFLAAAIMSKLPDAPGRPHQPVP